MDVYGIDYTSTPTARKPIVCLHAKLTGMRLVAHAVLRIPTQEAFEQALLTPGPWVAGLDFPFGQSRRFIEKASLPDDWADYVRFLGSKDRRAFRRLLEDYKRDRPAGDKHHRRRCDRLTRSQSPQTLYGTPVGLMFHEGAPRLLKSGVAVPLHRWGQGDRIALEAYPGFVARQLIGRDSYKSDTSSKQNRSRLQARQSLYDQLTGPSGRALFGLHIAAPKVFCDDPTGDTLDALICAAQAAWGWRRHSINYGAPPDWDPLEGWISSPGLDSG